MPHLAIADIARKRKLRQLYKNITDMIEWNKTENYERKNFWKLVQDVATQAEKQQVERKMFHAHSYKNEKRHTYVPHPRKSNLCSDKKGASKIKKRLNLKKNECGGSKQDAGPIKLSLFLNLDAEKE